MSDRELILVLRRIAEALERLPRAPDDNETPRKKRKRRKPSKIIMWDSVPDSQKDHRNPYYWKNAGKPQCQAALYQTHANNFHRCLSFCKKGSNLCGTHSKQRELAGN